MKRVVLKDFLSLKKGDIISFSNNGCNIIYITVENRGIDVPFYGNDKGRWGRDNPAPKSGNNPVTDYKPNVHFKWVKETLPPFVLIELKMPQRPKDLTKHLMFLYSEVEWQQMCMQKVINDLENQGVI